MSPTCSPPAPRCRPYPAGALFLLVALSALTLIPAAGLAQTRTDAAEPLVLSWRVGPEIDELEREYFGLFPKVDGFVGASARREGDAVVLTIRRLTRSDQNVRLSRAAFAELGRYVDSMERVRAGTIQIDWTLAPAVTPSNAYGQGCTVSALMVGGQSVSGRLESVDERGVTIWTGKGHYVPEGLRTNIVVIPFSRLDRISSGSMEWIGMATGASVFGALSGYVHTVGHEPPISIGSVFATTVVGGLVGAAAGSFLNTNVQYAGTDIRIEELAALSRDQTFYIVLPPELRAYSDSVFATDRTVRVAQAAREPTLAPVPARTPVKTLGLTIGCAVAPSRTIGTQGYTVLKSFNRSEPGVFAVGAYAMRAEVSFDLFPWLTIGVAYSSRGAVRSDTTDNSEWSSVKEPMAFVEFNATPPTEYRRRTVEPLLAVGGGYMLADYTAQLPSASGAQRRLIESDHELPLVLARAGIALNSMARLAFFFGVEARFVRSFTVPMYEFRHDPRPEFRYKWVEEHDVNLSTVEFQIGARFRI